MKYIKISFLLIIPLLPLYASSQQVSIRAQSQQLNEALADISDRYGIQVSFDDRALSKYSVTLNGDFNSPEEAIRNLLKELPFELDKKGEVFIIYPSRKPPKPKTFNLTGQVVERGSMESLPYSHVMINDQGVVTDLSGNFSYLSSTDSVFSIKVSHLGYYILDTMMYASVNNMFILTPSILKLPEIEIKNKIVERSTQIGDRPGLTKLNHQVAVFLPGFGDNSVFNLLRLQPGILAAGENTNELIIWGCYEGQSKVIFDGFTLYGLKNFNDNISAFNPLMAKDIEVYKGGYDARFGERVGGIVNITGKNGNTQRPSFTVDVNNMTLNGMVEIPIAKSGSLIFAVRHTYYELYNPGDFNSKSKRKGGKDSVNNVDINIVPDYRFRDINLKYSAKFRDRDLFYISLYAGNDRFSYSFDQPAKNTVISKTTTETNTQSGGSVFYGKAWKNGYSTNFSLNFSNLESEYSDELTIERIIQQTSRQQTDLQATNSIRESSIKVDNRFPVHPANTLEGGLEIITNKIELHEDTFNIVQAKITDEARRVTIYFQDNISIIKKIDLKAGLRLTQAINLRKFYTEPRLSMSIKLGESFKINAAWGMYNQFVTKSSVLDDLGNYRYIWTVCDNEDIPVLNSMHYVVGTSFNKSDFTVSLEGYYKNVEGLTRYIRNIISGIEGIYQGIGRSYGMDVMVKKDYKGHSAWISYSLSKTEELFEYFIQDEYRRAPQDQRHEVKVAALANFNPFFISADYVFGSGFPSSSSILPDENENLTYSRLDVAFIYRFLDRRVKGEIGLSVLNVLNTQNIKYANFERIAASQTNSINIYSESIPLTPALYLKVSM